MPPADLRRIWAKVPSIECQGKCANSCGPVECSSIERELIERRGARKLEPMRPALTCSMLKDGLCSVYSIRPVVCRLWGVVESMPCPHGCKPERTLGDREGFEIMAEAAELSGDPDGTGSMIREAMTRMSPEELDAFKRFISNSRDLGGDFGKRRRAAHDFESAMRRRESG